MNKVNVLLLPGWSFGKEVWLPLIAELKIEIHPVFVDWQGIEKVEDIAVHAERALIDLPKQEKTIVIGWSLGSLAALELVSRFPSLIDGVILFSATSSFINRDGYKFGWDMRIVKSMMRRLTKDIEGTIADFDGRLFSSDEEILTYLDVPNLRVDQDLTRIDPLINGLKYLVEQDVRSLLPGIKQPVKLIHGSADLICYPQASEFIYQQLGGEKDSVRINNTGHLPFYTKPSECAALVDNFIKKILKL